MKVGSLVECINKDPWQYIHNGEKHNIGPKYKEIVTVSNIEQKDGRAWICFCEYDKNSYFDMNDFREIQPPMDIKIEDIISEPVTHYHEHPGTGNNA